MELKSQWARRYNARNRSFNRTFMELKSPCRSLPAAPPLVLIVPLWNWNDWALSLLGSRRRVLIVPLWNWNIFLLRVMLQDLKVLIVPLWNWNSFARVSLVNKFVVLIVPLWNWNLLLVIIQRLKDGSNRTFMELKFFSPVIK